MQDFELLEQQIYLTHQQIHNVISDIMVADIKPTRLIHSADINILMFFLLLAHSPLSSSESPSSSLITFGYYMQEICTY